jgi:outer membrane receptor protein involved in Fe transport
MSLRLRLLAIELILCLLLPLCLAAQEITGVVIDRVTKKPLQLVNVSLLRAADTTIVTGSATDSSGRFLLVNVPVGTYRLRFSLLSYARRILSPVRVESTGRADVGTVRLVESPVDLQEVVVKGEKAMLVQGIDRKIYNVEQDLAAATGSASDLLRNIPSVEVDIDGNVTLRGSGDVSILVNGKTSPMMKRNSAEVLQQMPANAIERIEVITNPSARYRPEGTGGIIDIIMKKGTDLGFNGTATANAGKAGRYGGTVRLNYHPDGTNIFGNYSLRADRRERMNSDLRVQETGTPESSTYRQEGNSSASPRSHLASVGVEREFGRTTAALSGNYFTDRMTRNDLMHSSLNSGGTTSLSDRVTTQENSEDETGLKATLEHKFPEEDHEVKLEVQSSRQTEDEMNDVQTDFPGSVTLSKKEKVRNTKTERSTEMTLDYVRPFGDDARMEAGYLGEFRGLDFDSYGETFDQGLMRYDVNPALTNRFLHDEAMHALYATYQMPIGEFGIKGGIRGERVFRTSNLVSQGRDIESDYTSLYPSLHLSYKVSELAELQLNYSKRTRRPEGDDLNPFPEYRDPRNISAGNPSLLPEYIHSVEFGCRLQTELLTFLPALYYRYTNNRFTQVVRPLNDSTLLTTEENLANDRSAGVELVLSAGKGGLFSVNASGNAFYNVIDASNLGYSSARSVVSWSGSMTCNLRLFSSTMVQVNGNYRSSRLTPQGTNVPSGAVNIGIRQELWNKRFSLVLTVADLLRTMRRELQIDTPQLTERSVGTRDSRVFVFSCTFRFGALTEEKDEDALRYDNGL